MANEIKDKQFNIWTVLKKDIGLIMPILFFSCIGWYFLVGLIIGALIPLYIIEILNYQMDKDYNIDTGKKMFLDFKYNIEDSTNKGIIKSRYYMESKNRNDGDVSGYFYKMENGKYYNEILLEEKPSPYPV